MIFNDRLVMTPESHPLFYWHGWCYPKGGAALFAAHCWDPEMQAEPSAYIKRATPNLRDAGETAEDHLGWMRGSRD